MSNISLDNERAWQGDAAALASKVTFWANRTGLSDTSEITVRLIRDYAQRGIIAKPRRVSKSAIYDWEHLVRLLAARKLLSEGWPLQKISELFTISSIEEIHGMLPPAETHAKTLNEDPASSDLRQMRGRSVARELSAPTPNKKQAFGSMRTATSARFGLRSAQQELGFEAKDIKSRSMTRIEIAAGIELTIDQHRLRQMGQIEADAIARAVKLCLSDPKLRNNEDEADG